MLINDINYKHTSIIPFFLAECNRLNHAYVQSVIFLTGTLNLILIYLNHELKPHSSNNRGMWKDYTLYRSNTQHKYNNEHSLNDQEAVILRF